MKHESWLARTFFENPDDVIAGHRFNDHSRDVFLGVVHGQTQQIKREDGRTEYATLGGVPIGSNDDRHLITIAGSRSGKGRSALIPTLLSYRGNVIVLDVKGDNANRTALYRAEVLGHEVCVVDPFSVTNDSTKPYRKCFNALAELSIADPMVVENAGLIADSLITPNPNAKDPHWDESAKAFIETTILHVVSYEKFKAEDRHLGTVADLILGKRQSLSATLKQMMTNDLVDGRIIAGARAIQEKPDDERGSVISTAQRHVKFLDYDSVRDVVGDHEFSLRDLKRKKMTIYVCLPAMRLASCRGLLRLFINMMLAAMEADDRKPEIPILAIMDEFPVLGYMKEVETAAGQIAGLGVRLWPVIQDLGQLQAIYQKRWQTFLGNTGVIQCFGNTDHFTLEHLSKTLGKTTVTTSERTAQSRDQIIEKAATGLSEKQQTVPLLEPEEIARYFARDDWFCRQLIMMPGRFPYVISRANYDQHQLFRKRYVRD